MNNVISHYINNSPYKGINPRDQILLEKNLFTREKLIDFIFSYDKFPALPKINAYEFSIDRNKRFELIKRQIMLLLMNPEEQEKLDRELNQILQIQDPYKRLEKMYPVWLTIQTEACFHGGFTYPQGKGWEGDILTEEIEKMEGEIKRVYPNVRNEQIQILTMYFPDFIPYENELLIDTLDILSSLTEGIGSDVEIMQQLQEKLYVPEISEKLFLYSKKHFDGSIPLTLNQFLKYQNKKVKNLLELVLKSRKEKESQYPSILEELSNAFQNKEIPDDNFLALLERTQQQIYTIKYSLVKTMCLPIYDDYLPFRWYKLTQEMKKVIREINPKIREEDLSNFEGVDNNTRSILGMKELIYDEIWEKVRNDFEVKIKTK